jgi:site-specific DNA recombinase
LELLPTSPGERVINEAEAAVIRRIFKEYAEGISPRKIAEDLTRDRIPTPDGLECWNHQSFVGGSYARGIIGNRLYVGEIVWNSRRTVTDPETGKKKKRPTPESSHIITAAPHLRIIDQELWDAVHALRQRRAAVRSGGSAIRRPVVERNGHLLAGLRRCGECNGHMRIGQVSRNGSSRVVCAAAHQHGTCKHRKSYDMDVLKRLILANARENLKDPDRAKKMIRGYRAEYAGQARRDGAEHAAATKQLTRVKVQIDRITATILDIGNSPGMSAALAEKEAERAQLEERVNLLSSTNVVSLHPNAVKAVTENIVKLRKALSGESGEKS